MAPQKCVVSNPGTPSIISMILETYIRMCLISMIVVQYIRLCRPFYRTHGKSTKFSTGKISLILSHNHRKMNLQIIVTIYFTLHAGGETESSGGVYHWYRCRDHCNCSSNHCPGATIHMKIGQQTQMNMTGIDCYILYM